MKLPLAGVSARFVLCAIATLFFVSRVGTAAIVIDTVPVGNLGNPSDQDFGSGAFGDVSYNYRIGKYEVTNAQYTAFLNAVAADDTYGLYSSAMDTSPRGGIIRSGSPGSYTYSVNTNKNGFNMTNRPVGFVSFWDVARFANWMHNGQPTGAQSGTTTEDGAYTLSGQTGDGGGSITRNLGATWFVPSESEWYKAAYYDPSKEGGAGYWFFPTKSDSSPIVELPPGGANSANSNGIGALNPVYLTEVGSYTSSLGPYGTFDQAGNVMEWLETVVDEFDRASRGGNGLGGAPMEAAGRESHSPTLEDDGFGFRLGSVPTNPIPEPSSIILSGIGLSCLFTLRRRRLSKW